jgi:biopolymer transport protein ExbD
MKSTAYLHALHICITGVLLVMFIAQKSEISELTREVSVCTQFIESAAKAAMQNYDPKISIPPQNTGIEDYGITVNILDKERIQIGTDVYPFDEMTDRLTQDLLKNKKQALIIVSQKTSMEQVELVVNHLGQLGISDITFTQK